MRVSIRLSIQGPSTMLTQLHVPVVEVKVVARKLTCVHDEGSRHPYVAVAEPT